VGRTSIRVRSGAASVDRSTPGAGDFSDLEQAFFVAAPPDEFAPAAEPERFDDLVERACANRT
jgi:hypothetical protein